MKEKIFSISVIQIARNDPNHFEIVVKRSRDQKDVYKVLAEDGFPTKLDPWPTDGNLEDALLRMIRIIKNSQRDYFKEKNGKS